MHPILIGAYIGRIRSDEKPWIVVTIGVSTSPEKAWAGKSA
jgi:hypothetical protein